MCTKAFAGSQYYKHKKPFQSVIWLIIKQNGTKFLLMWGEFTWKLRKKDIKLYCPNHNTIFAFLQWKIAIFYE